MNAVRQPPSKTTGASNAARRDARRSVARTAGPANTMRTAVVMARYEAVGATVLRTDLNGQIEVITDGSSIQATTFAGRRMQLTN